MRRSIEIAGVLALLAWTALGLVAWLRVGEGLEITLAEAGGTSTQAEQELALLRERSEVLAEDVRGLSEALAANFGALADEVRAGRAELDALAHETRARTAPVEERAEQQAPPAHAAPPAAAPATAKSFLAFTLPSNDLRFDELRSFEVLGSLSRVGFDAKSTLHDFSGATQAVEGTFTTALGDPARGISGALRVRCAALSTGLEGRDDAMREHLDAPGHPTIAFELEGFEAGTLDVDARRVSGTVRGTLEVRGARRPFAMPVEVSVDDARRVVVEGEASLSLTAFGVAVPSKLGMISVDDEVRVWIHLRARPLPRAGR